MALPLALSLQSEMPIRIVLASMPSLCAEHDATWCCMRNWLVFKLFFWLQGFGVYRFQNKYGANVDGYSPIYTPDSWAETGSQYSLGVKGLLAW